MSVSDRNALIHLFDRHVVDQYIVVDLTALIIDDAYRLALQHQLRGYDAVQLATALTLNVQMIEQGLPGPTMVSNDREQILAARAEGLDTADPTELEASEE